MKNKINISVCVPAYNEAATLEDAVCDLFRTLSPCVGELEIIIVNDGSSDATGEICERLLGVYPQLKLITHRNNRGVGVAYRSALKIAKGDYFAWFPADYEDTANEFLLCLPHVDKDTVVTCHHRDCDRRSWPRRCLSKLYAWTLNKCFKGKLKYYNGMSIFPTKIVKSFPLVCDGFFLFPENLVRAVKKGLRVIEVSAPLRGRQRGASKMFSARSLRQMGKDAIKILLESIGHQKPNRKTI
ncbi:MAG: glycosyltransferase family 2 protein [Candidatus Omnitrophota bacterium]